MQMSQPFKARHIVLGRRGEAPVERIPGPKPVIEIHWWVAREKIKAAFIICLLLSLGFIAAFIGWQALAVFCVFGSLYGLITAGDVETGP